MSGAFNVGGLITGLDTNNLIAQLMQLERQPIVRLERRIQTLQGQQTALRELRTQLLSLRNAAQDFRFSNLFDQFTAASSESSVLTAKISGFNPVPGSFAINVTQLASATAAVSSGKIGAAIDPNAALDASGITAEIVGGDFTINGVTFTVDPTTQSLNTILGQINASAAGVTATYDAVTDTVTFENSTPGDTSLINFGATDDDSNLLDVLNVRGATQSTGGNGSTVATSTKNLGAVDPGTELVNVNFAGGAITSGSFSINGIAITVDASVDSILDVVARINDSDAQVTASYDTASDTIRVVSDTLGSRTVRFTSGTSNFLDLVNLTAATQTAGQDAQFTVNGGPVLTRNTNEVADAIGGVTLNLLSLGTSTVTVSTDDDSIVEDIQEFLTAYNDSVAELRTLTGVGSTLGSDGTLRTVDTFLRSAIFNVVTGISGPFQSLVDIGFSTGDTFDSEELPQVELDEDAFREALRDDRVNVKNLFSNTGETGVGDVLFAFLDEATRINGFLNERAKSNGTIDLQIQNLNDQIDRIEDRLVLREQRLRAQFTRLEQLSAGFQSQNSALSGLASSFSLF